MNVEAQNQVYTTGVWNNSTHRFVSYLVVESYAFAHNIEPGGVSSL